MEDIANNVYKKKQFFFSNFTSAPPIHRCLEVEGKEVGDAWLASYYVYNWKKTPVFPYIPKKIVLGEKHYWHILVFVNYNKDI